MCCAHALHHTTRSLLHIILVSCLSRSTAGRNRGQRDVWLTLARDVGLTLARIPLCLLLEAVGGSPHRSLPTVSLPCDPLEERRRSNLPPSLPWTTLVSFSYSQWSHFAMDFDVAVVGGGIGGLTCAYRLSRRLPEAKIAVIEAQDHVGGRVESGSLGGFAVEYGPIRVEPELQPRLCKLVEDLQVPTTSATQFPSNTAMAPKAGALRSEERRVVEAGGEHGVGPSMALLRFALRRVLEDQWDLEGDSWDMPQREDLKTELLKRGCYRGVPFHAQVCSGTERRDRARKHRRTKRRGGLPLLDWPSGT